MTMEFYSDIILLATPTGVSMEYILPNAEWKISYDLDILISSDQFMTYETTRRNVPETSS
jgi:hypothetical protein